MFYEKKLKKFNAWEQTSHESFSAPGQSPQTPLFKKLTLSNCNSNHSGSAFRHPVNYHLASILLLPRFSRWSAEVLPRCENGFPER